VRRKRTRECEALYILGLAYDLMIARGRSRAVDLRPEITKLPSMRK
jgi:hypothetical protein